MHLLTSETYPDAFFRMDLNSDYIVAGKAAYFLMTV